MKAVFGTAAFCLYSAVSMCAGAGEVPMPAEKSDAKLARQAVGDWVVLCAPQSGGHKSCMLSQTLASEKLGKTVGVLTIGRDRSGKLKGSFRLPVGVALAAGVVVGFEDKSPFNVPYSACHRIGCFAPFEITEPMLDRMRKATKISAVAQSMSQQAIKFDFSSRGFPAAYDAYVMESR
jgi:invasion protein IalB